MDLASPRGGIQRHASEVHASAAAGDVLAGGVATGRTVLTSMASAELSIGSCGATAACATWPLRTGRPAGIGVALCGASRLLAAVRLGPLE